MAIAALMDPRRQQLVDDYKYNPTPPLVSGDKIPTFPFGSSMPQTTSMGSPPVYNDTGYNNQNAQALSIPQPSGSSYVFPTPVSSTSYGGLPTLTGMGLPTVSEGSAGDLSTGQILGGLGAIGAGGLFGGASGAAGIAGDLLNLYGSYSSNQAKENIAKDVAQGYQTLGNTLSQQVQFKPFTVTSSTGAVQTTPEGGYSIGLTPQQQAMQEMLFSQAGGLFGQLGEGTAAREADVYNRIRALQTPAEEQARLATEERMAAQGRLGLSSAAYGGSTPELMAQEQAIQQARQAAALSAIQQAQAEQAQLANTAGGLLSSSYMPQAQMLNMLQPAVNLANIAGVQRQAGANILAEMAMNQMQAQAQAAISQQQQRQDISKTLGGLLTGKQTGGASILEQLFGKIFDKGGSSSNALPELQDLLNYKVPDYTYNPSVPDINIGDLTYDPNASYGLLGGKG